MGSVAAQGYATNGSASLRAARSTTRPLPTRGPSTGCRKACLSSNPCTEAESQELFLLVPAIAEGRVVTVTPSEARGLYGYRKVPRYARDDNGTVTGICDSRYLAVDRSAAHGQGVSHRHHLIGRLPARQGRHALAPGIDRGKSRGKIEPGLLGRIVQVSRQREIHDRRPVAQHEAAVGEMSVDDREGAFDPRSHIGKHGGNRPFRRPPIEKPVPCAEPRAF